MIFIVFWPIKGDMINVYTYLGIVSRRGLFHTLFSAPPPRFHHARAVTRQQGGLHSPLDTIDKTEKVKKPFRVAKVLMLNSEYNHVLSLSLSHEKFRTIVP